MAISVYIATSLDGFIATRDGDLAWLDEIPNPENSDYGYAEFMAGIDTIVMGRTTFQKVLTFDEWPYDKPVFVLSNHLSELPEPLAGQVEIIRGDGNGTLQTLVSQLHQRGYDRLYVDGGRTIQGFLNADLVDNLIITRVPILLGGGISLFGELDNHLRFTHQSTTLYGNGLVKSHYIRDRSR